MKRSRNWMFASADACSQIEMFLCGSGECLIGSTAARTFDGVPYEPRLRDGCQYLVAAATGRDDEFAILLDRQRRDRNGVRHCYFPKQLNLFKAAFIQALRIVLSEDVVVVNATEMTLTVNQVRIPLEPAHGRAPRFLLTNQCFGSMILARKILSSDNGTRLVIELPFHGVVLDVSSANDVIVKVLLFFERCTRASISDALLAFYFLSCLFLHSTPRYTVCNHRSLRERTLNLN